MDHKLFSCSDNENRMDRFPKDVFFSPSVSFEICCYLNCRKVIVAVALKVLEELSITFKESLIKTEINR